MEQENLRYQLIEFKKALHSKENKSEELEILFRNEQKIKSQIENDLQNQLMRSNGFEKLLKECQQEISILNSRIENEKKTQISVQSGVLRTKSLLSQIKELELENENNSKLIEKLKMENKIQLKKINRLTLEKENQSTSNKSLQEKYERLKVIEEQNRNESKKISSENESFKEKIDFLQNQLNHLEKQIQSNHLEKQIQLNHLEKQTSFEKKTLIKDNSFDLLLDSDEENSLFDTEDREIENQIKTKLDKELEFEKINN